jgi:hypothetical protein
VCADIEQQTRIRLALVGREYVDEFGWRCQRDGTRGLRVLHFETFKGVEMPKAGGDTENLPAAMTR